VQRFVQVTQRKSPRLAFIAGVAATHAALIVTFLLYDKVPLQLRLPAPKEITLILRHLIPQALPAAPTKKLPRQKSNAITLPPVWQNEILSKLGSTLACRSNYENLSPEERARCAFTPWAPVDPSTALMLGVEPPSIWAEALAQRKAPFVPMFVPCPLGSPGANLGLTCLQPDPTQAARWGQYLH
jgi:lambda repressor-like predicted transcriptional regulator